MYKCEICGKEHTAIWEYVACVSKCAEELKKKEEAERQQKRLEEVNAALNRVKEAKKYFEAQLLEFRNKYPEEYKLNFKSKCDDCNDWLSLTDEEEKPEVFTFSYEDNGKGKPVIKANGKEVSDDFVKDLFDDPDMKYVGKLLGLLN